MDSSCPSSPVLNKIHPLEFDQVSSTTAASMSSSSSYSSLASVRNTPTPGGIIGVVRKAVRRYQKCELCGDSSEQTQHCVHCGLTLCDKDRNKHIKEVIESLKSLKLTSNRHTKTANDKKDKISQTIVETEQSRQIAKQRVVDEFRHLNNILNSRKQELLNQLDAFGQDELVLLNEDKIILDQYVKELRNVEAEFHPRLASYTGMSDAALARLCQAKIAYQTVYKLLKVFCTDYPKQLRLQTSDCILNYDQAIQSLAPAPNSLSTYS
ncbi:uncharacterized protein LOC142338016 [Convolutriloba macropyga]|uniref:uncharacterized protein LOC142338016 n=1 Tax=Convolutriloba macropyga TaxID=536237 RepID=UPI003F51F6FE